MAIRSPRTPFLDNFRVVDDSEVDAQLSHYKRVYRDLRMKKLKTVSHYIACFHVAAFY
jgi:hypothetical protein